MQNIISTAALETLGKRRKRHNNRGLKIWKDEISQTTDEKKQSYLEYLDKNAPVNRADFMRLSALA
jgi:hypothetical protein